MGQQNQTITQLVEESLQLRRRLAAFELREAECQEEKKHWRQVAERLRLIADSSCDWEYWMGPDGQLQYVSPACERLTGYPPEEFTRDPDLLFRIVYPDDRAMFRAHLAAELVRATGPAAITFRVITRTGEVRWISHACQAVCAADGSPLGRRVSNRDLTTCYPLRDAGGQRLRELNEALEQRVAERTALAEERAAQLRALAMELTQAEERERRRLAQILHDNLQQLLAAAKISIDIMQGQMREHPLNSLLKQVGKLLDESITTSRSLTAELGSLILHDAGLGVALSVLARQIQERHNLEVVAEIDTEAEPDIEPLRVLLFQAARELLFNVVKHARARKIQVHMACDEKDQVCITVRDDGVGFDLATLHTGRDRGFGLFSIRERLELMGGRMVVDSAPGQGACIHLFAPLHQRQLATARACKPAQRMPPALAPATSPEAAAVVGEEESPSQQILRVLLVDDHEIMREGLASLLLMEEDIDVIGEASDGESAIDLARRLRPDVVVMDVSLPGISGVEATRRILAEHDDVAVIGLSMHEKGPMANAMREAGAVAYLTKGGPSDALIAAMHVSTSYRKEAADSIRAVDNTSVAS